MRMQSVTQTANVAIHADVIEVVFRCLNFSLVTLSRVVQCKYVLLTKRRIVVKVYLRIKTHNYTKQHSTSLLCTSFSGLASINVVTLRHAQLVPGWLTILRWVKTSVQNQAPTSTQPGHPSVGRHNEYWLWPWPLLGKNGESCVTVGPVIRTAGILAYSQLQALPVNGAGHPADAGCMLTYLESTLTISKRRNGPQMST